MPDNNTYFGYRQVTTVEKTNLVAQVFRSVAPNYDLMNDLMSFGIHRYWKNFTVMQSRIRRGQKVLDLAGGTGDLTAKFARLVGDTGEVILADINPAMLAEARKKLLDQGIFGNVAYVETNAETLAFADNYFDCITIAFGLRNVTDIPAALNSIFRVLKPGGQLLVLEFSKPAYAWLTALYGAYSFYLIPILGKYIADDEASYRYLVESIRMHPDQITLLYLMQQAGFEACSYHNLSGGIVALHRGYKC